MIARWLAGVIVTICACSAWSQTPPDDAPDPVDGWFNFVDASEDVFLTQGVNCPGCRTIEEFRNAARTGCFTGYREAETTFFNAIYASPTLAQTPGAVPDGNGEYHVANADDPCVYNVEIRGNLRDIGVVRLWVCNDENRCLLVAHQYIPTCLGIGARINPGGILSAQVTSSCLITTGLEGICTTVRTENLNEDTHCITMISDKGRIFENLPPIPGYPPDYSSPGDPPPGTPPGPGVQHGEPGHTPVRHITHCIEEGPIHQQ